MMRSVAIVVFAGVQSLDVSGPMDVFQEANAFVPEDARYDLVVVGPTETFKASNGMLMSAHLAYDATPDTLDLVLVAGGPTLPSAKPESELLEGIVRLTSRSKRYGSVCTGAFLLGHAGLLDGRKVTTHWQHAAALAEQFPHAEVDKDRIYLRDGNLMTSAGVTAGIDLALAIVNEDHGAEVALAVAKRLVVVAQRRGGQSQFSPYMVAPSDDASPLGDISNFVMSNLKGTLTVTALAQRLGMSRRNFARFFPLATNTTPADFVEQARIDAARNLLEGSHLALKEIAFECGFGSAHRMRQVFARRLGVTPGHYRASFQRH